MCKKAIVLHINLQCDDMSVLCSQSFQGIKGSSGAYGASGVKGNKGIKGTTSNLNSRKMGILMLIIKLL